MKDESASGHVRIGATDSKVRVLMVCMGNICRSPTAHAVFEHLVREAQLEDRVEVDSAGTGAWHVGEAPDRRSSAVARERGYLMDEQRSRQVTYGDFEDFDYIMAMDEQNLATLQEACPQPLQHKLALFLSYSSRTEKSVPDPYYSGAQGFDLVLDMVEEASQGLLDHLRRDQQFKAAGN